MKKEIKQYFLVILGGFLFALGVNLFITPLNLYSAGLVGIAQIIRTLLIDYAHLPIPSSFDIAGIISFCLNIPLMVLAYKTISKKFFLKTLLNIATQMITISLIAIPEVPIIVDPFPSCVVGGIISGFGIGIALQAGGSSGGFDILGMYFTKKVPKFSVGTMNLWANIVIYSICAIMFNITTALYSIINLVVFIMVVDKTHYQNIDVSAMVFTKKSDLHKIINKEMVRGVTYWKGAGAYLEEESYIFVCVFNKYEVRRFKELVAIHDPSAFVVVNEEVQVLGNFEKRL